MKSLETIEKLGRDLANMIYGRINRWTGYSRAKAGFSTARAPFIAVTTRVGCKNMCVFCPQDKFIAAYRERLENSSGQTELRAGDIVLTLDNFREFLGKIPENTTINFAGFSEPWTNPDCTEMCLIAHERGHRIRVFTTLVGMKPDDIERLRQIPFQLLEVHVPDEKETSSIRLDDVMRETLLAIKEGGLSNLSFHNHVGNPHPDFSKIIGRALISRRQLQGRAGAVEYEDALIVHRRHTGRIRCSFNPGSMELDHNILLPNGDVVLCCQDWELKHVLGNLKESSLASIYESPTYQNIKNGLDDDTIESICRFCPLAVPLKDEHGKVCGDNG